MKKRLIRILQFIFNVFLPPRCPICHIIVQDKNGLCPQCFRRVHFLTDQACPICGRPYTFPIEDNQIICGKCLKHKPVIDGMKALFAYDNFSRQLILPLKHADYTQDVPLLAELLYKRTQTLLQKCDYIVPVPLHWRRMLKRKYNQSALIANYLARKSHKICLINTLIRIKNTQSQGHKTKLERKENLKNAFVVKNNAVLTNKVIVLVDDVYTTGITVNECAIKLKESGAKKVFALTLARVCRFE